MLFILFYLLLLQYLCLLSAAWVINATLDGGVWLYCNTECCFVLLVVTIIIIISISISIIIITLLVLAVGSVGHQRDDGRRGVAGGARLRGLLGLLRARGAWPAHVTRSRDAVT